MWAWINGVPTFNGVLTASATAVTSSVPFVGPSGTASATTFNFGVAGTGIFGRAAGEINFAFTGTEKFRTTATTFGLASTVLLGWNSATDWSGSTDLFVAREAAGHLFQRNSTNAQLASWANTYTSSTNYEAFSVDWQTTANTCLVGTVKGSGGGNARAMSLVTDGVARIALGSGGEVTVRPTVATPANGSTSARLVFGTTSGFGVYYGSGAPTVSAAQGSIYLRSDGSSNATRLYVNTDGSTGWTNFTSAT